MHELLIGAGLVLVIEGLAYVLAPLFVKRMAAQIARVDEQTLRIGGLLALALGVFLVWLTRG